MKRYALRLAVVVPVLCFSTLASNTLAEVPKIAFNTSNISNWNYKGISFSGYWHSDFNNEYIYEEIDYFRSLGLNSVELVVTWYQDTMSSDTIYSDPNKTIDDRDLRQVIQYVKNKGMKVNLKPHVDPFPEIVPRIHIQDFENILNNIKDTEDKQLLLSSYSKTKDNGTYILNAKLDKNIQKKCWDILISKGFDTWRARFNPINSEKWFKEYKKFLNHYLQIAKEYNVDVFTIGTELVSMTRPVYLNKWKSIVNALRSSGYKGKIVYTAHEHEIFGVKKFEIGDKWKNPNQLTVIPITDQKINPLEKQSIRKFWSLFDYISMTVYFELGGQLARNIEWNKIPPTDKNGEPSLLIQKWEEKAEELRRWKKELRLDGKKVFFGELGYRSVDYGHYKPYLPDVPIFDTPEIKTENIYNSENQLNCYYAMFKTLNNIDWLEGVFLWEEQIKSPPLYSNTRNTGYSLIGKPVASLIGTIYRQPFPSRTPEFNPNLVFGYWYYYDDQPKQGNSSVLINQKPIEKDAEGKPIFRYIIENIINKMKQVSQLSGKVTKRYEYGYIGMGVDFSQAGHEEMLNKVVQAKGIKFKTRGDGKKYRCRLEATNVTNSNYHGKYFVTKKGDITEVTIEYNNPKNVKQENWGPIKTEPKPFRRELIKKISFQTVGQPHKEVFLQVWDLEVIK